MEDTHKIAVTDGTPSEPVAQAIAAPQAPTVGEYIRANFKALVVIALVLALGIAYLHQTQTTKHLQAEVKQATPAQSATQTTAQLRAEVAKILELPSNETPTLATVTDASKLKNQSFFADAKDGDKVLMFAKAQKAVLYRPSDHKIVAVSPINLGGTGTAATASSLNVAR